MSYVSDINAQVWRQDATSTKEKIKRPVDRKALIYDGPFIIGALLTHIYVPWSLWL